LYSKDSIHFADSLKFKTDHGRTVYGGGGIMPDVFVPQDTTAFGSYLSQLLNKGVLREVATEMYATQKQKITAMTMEDFSKYFQVTDGDLNRITAHAEKEGVKFNQKGFDRSKEYIRNYLKALIAKTKWQTDGFFFIFNQRDNVFVEAQKHWIK
jgi:carboxyl-terminal processing protease